MRVLVACEESQVVCKAFRDGGHEAYSCDIKPCTGGKPEWHMQGDAVEALHSRHWDLLIAHPPCTYLTKAGATLLHINGGFEIDEERYTKLLAARQLFMMFWRTKQADAICVENPTPLKAACLPKPSQVIQPCDFGHPYTKRTCLWLRNLPPLMATYLVPKNETESWTDIHRSPTQRSKTFPGIAQAMAYQWG